MKILVIGNGGREHAIAWKLAQSPLAEKIFVAKGNAGTHREPKIENIDISPLQFQALVDFVKQNNIAFTVVGPEAPLVAGIVDFFRQEQLPILGPTQAAAQLEGSKLYAKEFMQKYDIPTAKASAFSDINMATAFLSQCQFPVVIKADGLAEGKGVIIAEDKLQAEAAIDEMLTQKRFGTACETILIEEFLTGMEVSFIALCDGQHFIPLATSQDHKARDDGDKGPNTGGMGAYSPAPMMTPELNEKVINQIIKPTLQGMIDNQSPYVGFLYVGLMLTPDNQVKVLEYNCRMGDPETQPIMMRLTSDFVSLCHSAIHGTLKDAQIAFDSRVALGVVIASKGYPGQYDKNIDISHLKEIASKPESKVFHAGTKTQEGMICTNGGRVLCVTALGGTYQNAQKNAYALVQKVTWDGAYFRTDIGQKALSYSEI